MLSVLAPYGNIPLSFEANVGQTDAQVDFVSRGAGYSMFLSPTQAVLSLHGSDQAVPDGEEPPATTCVLRVQLVGADPAAAATGLEALAGKSNYYVGSDPAQWHTDVPLYAKVLYEDVYPGVDQIYSGNQGELEYDFIVAPGGNPGVIRVGLEGADSLEIDALGNLVVHTASGDVVHNRPIAYQEVGGSRQPVDASYVLQPNGEVAFDVGDYDLSHPLIIDPVLTYSTYLGGSDYDEGNGIAVDATGAAYVAGVTTSIDFPTTSDTVQLPGALDDVFVTKLSPDGSSIVYSSYLGGGARDTATGIAVDALGNSWVSGHTQSLDFPTVNAFQGAHAGGRNYEDAFVAKLSGDGSALLYSTYLGGSGDDKAHDIAVDAAGNAYVTGQTGNLTYNDFPTVNPLFGAYAGNYWDAFVTKFDSTGSVPYSTYLGGNSSDVAQGIAVDSYGAMYVVGFTQSTDFPTQNAFQPTRSSPYLDAFVTKFTSAGDALVYSTYLGGTLEDRGRDIAVDSSGAALVTGETGSSDFPTYGAIQSVYGGGSRDGYVTKLSSSGSTLGYSTFLGGSGYDVSYGVAVDGDGNAYLTGSTWSADFPAVNPLSENVGGDSDAFVTSLDATGSTLLYSSELGGTGGEVGNDIAVDSSGAVYVTGYTGSYSFPTVNAVQPIRGGRLDAFVAKILPTPPNTAPDAVDDSYTVDEDHMLAADAPGVLGNDSDADGDALSAVLVGGVTSGTLVLSADGSFTYEPAADFNGTDSFTYVANDGQADSNVATVTITVNPINDAPVADDQSVLTDEDTPVAVTLTASDVDEDSLTFTIVDGPKHGTLTGAAPGLTYTPEADYFGPDAFTFQVSDGQSVSNVATVSITVSPVNDAPVAADDTYQTDEDTPLVVAASGLQSYSEDFEDPAVVDANWSPYGSAFTVSGGVGTLWPDGAVVPVHSQLKATLHDKGAEPVVLGDLTYAVDVKMTSAKRTMLVFGLDSQDRRFWVGYDIAGGLLQRSDDQLSAFPSPGTWSLVEDYRPYDGQWHTWRLDVSGAQVDFYVDAHHVLTGQLDGYLPGPVGMRAWDAGGTQFDNVDVTAGGSSTPPTSQAAGVLENDSDVEDDALTALLVDPPANGTLALNADGSFSYTPNQDFNGTDTFTYRANDGAADSNVATVRITVNPVDDPPVAADDAYGVDEDNPLTVAAPGVLVNDTDVDGDALSAVLVAGPANGTLALSADGSFDYTPEADFHGTDTFVYTAGDSGLSAVPVFQDTFDRPDNADVDAGTAGMSGTAAPLAYYEKETASVAGGTLSLDGWSSLVVPEHDFTDPSIVSAGQFVMEFDANPPDTAGPEGYANGVAVSFGHSEATAKGGGFRVSYWVEKAFGLVLSGSEGIAAGRCEVHNAVPPAGWNDLAPIGGVWTTFDQQPTAGEWYHVRLTVRPKAGQQLFTAGHEATVLVQITGDLDGDQGTPSQDTFEANLEFDWPRESNFVVLESGGASQMDNFGIRTQGAGDTATVTITVNPVNDAPVTADQALTTEEDTPVAVVLTASDVENDPLTFSIVSGPAHGTLAGTAPNLTYTPDADYNGPDAFTFRADDGELSSNVATVSIAVTPVPDAPVARDDEYAVDEDQTLVVAAPGVLANDGDADGDTLTAVLVAGVSHGTLSLAPDGSFEYTPAADFYGTDSFTYTASDGSLSSNVATVTISVNAVNDPPVAVDDAYEVRWDEVLSVAAPGVLSNDNDVEADPLTAALVSGVSHGTLSLHPDGSFDYTPEAGYYGIDSFTYIANDGTDDSATATVTITVKHLILSGRVFDDRDNDGLFEPGDGDAGLEGVTVELVDQTTGSPVATYSTLADGTYEFDLNLDPGTYLIRQTQPEGYLDGKETAGDAGGTVDNTQDSSEIRDIVVGVPGSTAEGSGYNFAELLPASLQGLVWEDFDDDGQVDLGELAVDGAAVTLTGTDERGAAVSLTQTTDSQGIFEFVDLRPGTYAVAETQPTSLGGVPTDFVDGQDVPGEVIEHQPPSPAVVLGDDGVVDPLQNDTFSGVVLVAGSQGVNYNFGERIDGGALPDGGVTATIGFWQNKNGQELIGSLNGGSESTLLADWLATTFPNMYGSLAGMDNAGMGDLYQQLFKRNAKTSPGGPPKLDAQVLAVAMATYVTKDSLCSLSAATGLPDAGLVGKIESYGFQVTAGGVGSTYFNLGDSGEAFDGYNDYDDARVIDLLLATDRMSLGGLLYDDADGDGTGNGEIDSFEELLRTLANDIYSAINEQGDI